MASLGERLRAIRDEKNLSLDDVANATKINKNILVALENDQYELLPPKVFVKGFLRSYARYVGMEVDELWDLYEKACGSKTPAEIPKKSEIKQKKFRPGPFIFLLILFGLLLVGLLPYFYRLQGNNETLVPPASRESKPKPSLNVQPPLDKTRSPEEAVSPAEKASPEGEEHPDLREKLPSTASYLSEQKGLTLPQIPSPAPPPLPIQIKATCYATTWIGYVIDNGQTSQTFLYPGDEFSWEAKEKIELKIGNAGGIKITINGIALKPLGKSGEVVRVVFTKEFLTLKNGEPQKLELWQEKEQPQSQEE